MHHSAGSQWGVAALNTMPSGVITSLLIDATGQAEEVLQVVQTGASHRSARGLRRGDNPPFSKSACLN